MDKLQTLIDFKLWRANDNRNPEKDIAAAFEIVDRWCKKKKCFVYIAWNYSTKQWCCSFWRHDNLRVSFGRSDEIARAIFEAATESVRSG